MTSLSTRVKPHEMVDKAALRQGIKRPTEDHSKEAASFYGVPVVDSDSTCKKGRTCRSHSLCPLRTRVVAQDKLYVSQPSPEWFGNKVNTPTETNWNNKNWLKSRLHFSFAEYYNPKNNNFGPIRVINDDIVQPKRGFGEHPHENMEILTYIVNGELTHKDTMGRSESLGRGSVQFITAGRGVSHSEFNDGDRPLRYIEIWIVPRRRGLPTNSGSYQAPKDNVSQTNILQYLASDAARIDIDTPAKVNQDVEFMAAELDLGGSLTVDIRKGRQAYLLCIEGALKVNGKSLEKHDGMEIFSCGTDGALKIDAIGVEETESGQVAHFMLLVMAAVPGSGRGDLA
jgi:redox-sensitive bicupin YhaK (pirin superfamily)